MKVSINKPELSSSAISKSTQTNPSEQSATDDVFLEMLANLFPQNQLDPENLTQSETDQVVENQTETDISDVTDKQTAILDDAINLLLTKTPELQTKNEIDINLVQTTDLNEEQTISVVDSMKNKSNIVKKSTEQTQLTEKVSVDSSEFEMPQDFEPDSTGILTDDKIDQRRDIESKSFTDNNKSEISANKFQNNQHVELIAANNSQAIVLNKNTGYMNETDDKSKYIDALKNLGNLINQHTSQLADTNQLNRASLQRPSTTYAETAQSLFGTMPEPKIELSSTTLAGIGKELHQADIKIHPPELGHVVAKLKVNENTAELVIMTQSHRVREVVEANLPQLKDHFQHAAINLASIHVEVQTANSNTNEQLAKKQRDTLMNPDLVNDDNQGSNVKKDNKNTRVIDSIIDTYI